MELRPGTPYDWPGLRRFFCDRAIPGVESCADGRYQRTIEFGGCDGTVTVDGEVERSTLVVDVGVGDAASSDVIAERLRTMFDVDSDPSAIGEALAANPRLAPLVAARRGLLAEHGADDQFERIPAAGYPQPGPRCDQRCKGWVGSKCLADRRRVGIDIEHGTEPSGDHLGWPRTSNIDADHKDGSLDIAADGDRAGASADFDCSLAATIRARLDTGNGALAEEAVQPWPVVGRAGAQLHGRYFASFSDQSYCRSEMFSTVSSRVFNAGSA